MKNSEKIGIAGVLMSILGWLSLIGKGEYTSTIMIITWMCIIGSMIIEKLEKHQP